MFQNPLFTSNTEIDNDQNNNNKNFQIFGQSNANLEVENENQNQKQIQEKEFILKNQEQVQNTAAEQKFETQDEQESSSSAKVRFSTNLQHFQLGELKNQLEKAKLVLSEKELSENRLKNEIKILQQNLQKATENEQKNAQKQQICENCISSLKEIEIHKGEIENLKNFLHQQQERHGEIQREKGEVFERQLETVKAELDQQELEFQEQVCELKENYEAQVADLQAQIEFEKTNQGNIKNVNVSFLEEQAQTCEELEKIKCEKAGVEEKNAELLNLTREYQQHIKLLEREKQSLAGRVDELISEMQRESHQVKKKTMESEVQQLQLVADLQANLKKQEAANQILKGQISSFEAKIASLKQENFVALQFKESEINTQVEELKRKLSANSEEFRSKLEAELKKSCDLTQENQQMQAEMERLKHEIKTRNQEQSNKNEEEEKMKNNETKTEEEEQRNAIPPIYTRNHNSSEQPKSAMEGEGANLPRRISTCSSSTSSSQSSSSLSYSAQHQQFQSLVELSFVQGKDCFEKLSALHAEITNGLQKHQRFLQNKSQIVSVSVLKQQLERDFAKYTFAFEKIALNCGISEEFQRVKIVQSPQENHHSELENKLNYLLVDLKCVLQKFACLFEKLLIGPSQASSQMTQIGKKEPTEKIDYFRFIADFKPEFEKLEKRICGAGGFRCGFCQQQVQQNMYFFHLQMCDEALQVEIGQKKLRGNEGSREKELAAKIQELKNLFRLKSQNVVSVKNEDDLMRVICENQISLQTQLGSVAVLTRMMYLEHYEMAQENLLPQAQSYTFLCRNFNTLLEE